MWYLRWFERCGGIHISYDVVSAADEDWLMVIDLDLWCLVAKSTIDVLALIAHWFRTWASKAIQSIGHWSLPSLTEFPTFLGNRVSAKWESNFQTISMIVEFSWDLEKNHEVFSIFAPNKATWVLVVICTFCFCSKPAARLGSKSNLFTFRVAIWKKKREKLKHTLIIF